MTETKSSLMNIGVNNNNKNSTDEPLDVLSRAAAVAAAAAAAASSSTSTSASFISPSQLMHQLLAVGTGNSGQQQSAYNNNNNNNNNNNSSNTNNNSCYWPMESTSQNNSSGTTATTTTTSNQSISTGGNPEQIASQLLAHFTKEFQRSGSRPDKHFFCLICGQTTPGDLNDYEQHLVSHLPECVPLMQNLLNGNNSNGEQIEQSSSTTVPMMKNDHQHGSSPSVMMNKKRKLLSQNHHHHHHHHHHHGGGGGEDTENGSGTVAVPSNTTNTAIANTTTTTTAFPCTSCHKTFATEVDLKAHMIRHLTQHPFICNFCGKGFKYGHSLNFHVKSYHSAGSKENTNTNNSSSETMTNDLSSSSKSLTKSKDLAKCNTNNGLTDHDGTTTNEISNNSSLRLKRKSTINTNQCSEMNEKKKIINKSSSSAMIFSPGQITNNETTTATNSSGTDISGKSSVTGGGSLNFMTPTLITDENHNQTTFTRTINWSKSDLSQFYGKIPTNLLPDTKIRIKKERILVSILDAVNDSTGQSMVFYKCCLCCVAFPSLDQMNLHVQNVHDISGDNCNSAAAAILAQPSGTPIGTALELGKTTDTGSSPLSNPKQQQEAMATAIKVLFSKSDSIDSGTNKSTNKNGTKIDTGNETSGNSVFQCDKCLAKFNRSFEYTIHSRLHCTLENSNTGTGNGGHSPAGQQSTTHLQLLNSLMMAAEQQEPDVVMKNSSVNIGDETTESSPTTGDQDFPAHLLANAVVPSNDFGRNFAAHLMNGCDVRSAAKAAAAVVAAASRTANSGSCSDDKLSIKTSGIANTTNTSENQRFSPNILLPCSPSKSSSCSKLEDSNNNSLLYISGGIPTKIISPPPIISPKKQTSNNNKQNSSKIINNNRNSIVSKNKIDTVLNLSDQQQVPSTSGVKFRTKSTGKTIATAGSSSSTGSSHSSSGGGGGDRVTIVSTRHLKEPIDIFDGAGQSLPIQKFPLGEIEETSPGQFKCRFCEKTFDRVFSVHRHERIHTGFKPVKCKYCSRGFSEKRNLRHHIIRFHSDGSGRELLKRKRKPKSGSSMDEIIIDTQSSIQTGNKQRRQQQQIPTNFMSSFLSSAAGSLLMNALQFQNSNNNNGNNSGDDGSSPSPTGSSFPGNTGATASLSNLKLSLNDLNRNISQTNIPQAQPQPPPPPPIQSSSSSSSSSGIQRTLLSDIAMAEALNLSPTPSGSSRRRKSKPPSRKVVTQDDDEDDGGVGGPGEDESNTSDTVEGNEKFKNDDNKTEQIKQEIIIPSENKMEEEEDEDETEEETEPVDSDATTEEPDELERNQKRSKSKNLSRSKPKSAKNRNLSGSRKMASASPVITANHGRARRSSSNNSNV